VCANLEINLSLIVADIHDAGCRAATNYLLAFILAGKAGTELRSIAASGVARGFFLSG
jgi:hypothetical protein